MWATKLANGYAVTVNGNKHKLSVDQIGELIRQKLMKSRSIQSLMHDFEMDVSSLKNLQIEIMPLDKKYAETDGDSMRLNEFLFDDGNFFKDFFFVVVHELVHWLSRKKEEEAYMNDPEEVLGFCASVAYEIERGTEIDAIWNLIYPKISWHFNDENDAREFFMNMIEKAQKLLR